jgi:hypothetical protein
MIDCCAAHAGSKSDCCNRAITPKFRTLAVLPNPKKLPLLIGQQREIQLQNLKLSVVHYPLSRW